MIPELGHFSLILALLLAISAAMTPFGRWLGLGIDQQGRLAYSMILGQAFFICLSFATLVLCFIENDFSVQYVAQNSNSHLPILYRFCAVWGAHEGSLLLWSLILSLWTLGVAIFSRQVPSPIKIQVLAILGALQVGFLLLILQTSDPFLRYLPYFPTEGADLNPLLQDPAFVLHPPFLYMGYVGFAVPFAFAMAECLHKTKQTLSLPWVSWVRSWALFAVGFLSIGITLGSWWAYYELGWGGWWFWDPVENASFMPWLIGVALIHALWASKDRPVFKAWRLFLAIFAFLLSLIGTFLVRSGILSSVHAFASDATRGSFILGFISVVMISAFALFFHALKDHQSKIPSSFFCKESLILLGNVLLVVATLTVMLGTLYPLVTEILWQQKISVGPPYFNSVFIPMTLPLLLIMSVAIHVRLQNDSLARMITAMKRWRVPLLIACGLLTGFLYHRTSFMAGLGLVLAVGLIFSTVAKVIKQRQLSQQWGFVLGHCGIAFLVMGISLSTSLQTEKELIMAIGESKSIAGFSLRFDSLKDIQGANFEGQRGHFTILQNGKTISELEPEKRFFLARGSVMTETAIKAQGLSDFYIALGEPLENGAWSVRFYIKPFIRLLWLGGLLIALGALYSGFHAFRQTLRGNVLAPEPNNTAAVRGIKS